MKILKMSRWKIALLAVALVAVLVVGGTVAILAFRTDGVENVFTSGVVNIEVEEDFDDEADIRTGDPVKKLVCIKNDSMNGQLNVVPIYIRVKLVANWVEDDGSVVAIDATQLLDYNLNLDSSSKTAEKDVDGDWVLGEDGFYYFTKAIDPDTCTDYLLESVSAKEGAVLPETGHLEINVLADAIQANGDAYINAWGDPKTNDGTSIY